MKVLIEVCSIFDFESKLEHTSIYNNKELYYFYLNGLKEWQAEKEK